MADVLTPTQFCLGFDRDYLDGRNALRFIANYGAPVIIDDTFSIPAVGDVFYNDRNPANADQSARWLLDSLNQIETALVTGATWSLTHDLYHPALATAPVSVLGYNTWTRSAPLPAGHSLTISWSAVQSTVDPLWYGFSGDLATTVLSGQDRFSTEMQVSNLWCPGDRYPTRFEAHLIQEATARLNPFNGTVRRYGHGGYTVWQIEFEYLKGLFVYKQRSEKSSYLSARTGVQLNDQNVSWEGGTFRHLKETDAPVRIFPDRTVFSDFIDTQVFRPQELTDLTQVFTEQSRSNQNYRSNMMLVQVQ